MKIYYEFKGIRWYDDWSSNSRAYIWRSLGWFIILPMGILMWTYNGLIKLVDF